MSSPNTPAGKQNSSRYAIHYGLLAKCVGLANESREGFDAVLAQYLERFALLDDTMANHEPTHELGRRALENLYALRNTPLPNEPTNLLKLKKPPKPANPFRRALSPGYPGMI